jgi:hypothetical protein
MDNRQFPNNSTTEDQIQQFSRLQMQKEAELRSLSVQRTRQLENLVKSRDMRVKELSEALAVSE